MSSVSVIACLADCHAGRSGRGRAAWAIGWGLVTLAGLCFSAMALGADGESPEKPVPGLEPAQGTRSTEPDASIYLDPEGRARTSMFGVSGLGHKFVYVLDRSGSMGGAGQLALRAVKAELRKSLEKLDTVHQFQIIFYNEKPSVFNPSGIPGRLAFADQGNKDRAVRFIDSIVPDGNTRHDQALKLAIRMRPDVIFFLTDGDDPRLSRRELDQIQRMAAGITINAIEFGPGPPPEEKSFLATLAKENGGQYVYVDLSKRRDPSPKQDSDR